MAPTVPKFLECRELFSHHQSIPEDVMRINTIGGGNGAFKIFLADRGVDTDALTVGVGVMINPRGEIVGTQLLTCGSSGKIPKMSTKDMWSDSLQTGSISFQDFDIGILNMPKQSFDFEVDKD